MTSLRLHTLLAAVLAGVLVLAARSDPVAVTAVVVVGQLLLAAGVAASRPTGRTGTFVVVAGAGVAASVLVELVTGPADLGALAPAAAGLVLAALVREMLRRDGRAGLVESVALTAAGGLLGVLLASWSANESLLDGPVATCLGAGGVAVAALLWTVPGPRGLLGSLGPVVAAAGGWLAADWLEPGYPPGAAAVVAATGALAAVVGLTTSGWWQPVSRARAALVATVPLALAGPVVHVASRFAAVWS